MERTSKSLNAVLRLLERDRLGEYAQEDLPGPTDEAVTQLTQWFRDGSDEEREQIRSAATRDHTFGLLTFARRMAVLTVRTEDPSRAQDGLTAIVIENFDLDLRESMPAVALLNHSLAKVGADPTDVFKTITRFATPDVANTLIRYVAKKESEKSIESMGYVETEGPGGFDYERQW